MVNIGMKFIHLQVNEDVVYPVSENQATSGEAEKNYRMEDESMSEESDNTSTAGENISMIDEPNSPIASIESDLEDMPDPVVEDSDPSPAHFSITSKIQRYDSTLYEKFEAITPLYEGSSCSDPGRVRRRERMNSYIKLEYVMYNLIIYNYVIIFIIYCHYYSCYFMFSICP